MVKVIQNQKREYLSFTDLYEMYSQDLFRYSLSILKDEDDAKDAVQESFVRYIENEKSFRGDCSQKTWLLIIARNFCYSKIKRADRNNELIDEDTFEEVYELKLDEALTLKDSLKLLTPQQNELLFLKEYSGYSYNEISEITRLSPDNVKVILFRARQKLKKLISR